VIENFAPAVALLIPSALTSEVTALTVAPIGLDRAVAISRTARVADSASKLGTFQSRMF
jgi:hypothetical protein